MPALATLIIAFVGIGGKDAGKIDRQVHALLDLNGAVGNVELSKDDRHTLANHKDGCKGIVKRLHASGVIAGELIDEGGTSLRLVVYKADGSLLDFIEMPLDKHALAKGDIESLRETVLPDVD